MANPGRTARKLIEYLIRKGPKETARRALLRFGRKRLEKRYVRSLNLPEEEKELQRRTQFSRKVLFSIAVPLYNTPPELLRETIASVKEQTYAGWQLCLVDGSDAAHGDVREYCEQAAREDPRILYRKLDKNGGISENTNACLEMATGDYIALFDHDDLLLPNALYEAAKAVCEKGADFVYSDEIVFESPDREKVIGARFKPDFSPETLLSNNYICHLTVFSRKLLEKAGPFRKEYDGSQDHDMVLRLTDVAERIVHIPKVLYLWRAVPTSVASDISSKTYAIEAGRNAVRAFLKERRGTDAAVESTEAYPTLYRVRYPLEGEPSVHAFIWLGSKEKNAAERIRALKEKTSWKNWTVTAVTEEAGRTGRAAALAEAARNAKEDYLLFTDGIPEALTGDWIEQLLMFAQQKEIGAVGGKLLFTENSVRHAGVILGLGEDHLAGRAYYRVDGDSAGYFGQMAVAGNVSAVTAECMLVSRAKYEAAGGFPADYTDALFDVDFCLTLLGMGWRNVYTPFALLRGGKAGRYYLELGKETPSYTADAALFRKRRKKELETGDPYYNPNLSLRYEDYRIAKK